MENFLNGLFSPILQKLWSFLKDAKNFDWFQNKLKWVKASTWFLENFTIYKSLKNLSSEDFQIFDLILPQPAANVGQLCLPAVNNDFKAEIAAKLMLLLPCCWTYTWLEVHLGTSISGYNLKSASGRMSTSDIYVFRYTPNEWKYY